MHIPGVQQRRGREQASAGRVFAHDGVQSALRVTDRVLKPSQESCATDLTEQGDAIHRRCTVQRRQETEERASVIDGVQSALGVTDRVLKPSRESIAADLVRQGDAIHRRCRAQRRQEEAPKHAEGEACEITKKGQGNKENPRSPEERGREDDASNSSLAVTERGNPPRHTAKERLEDVEKMRRKKL